VRGVDLCGPRPQRLQAKEARGLGDLLLVTLFLGMVLWVGWPVTLWVVSAGVVALAARFAARWAANQAWARAIADVLAGIAIGVGVVWLAQLVLTGAAGLAGTGTVRSAETWIAAFHSAHERFMLPAVLVVGIALALRVWRRHAPTATWALAALGAVPVFGGLALRSAEARWVASRRIEASSDLRSLRAAQTRLVAIAEVRQKLARLSAEDMSYEASFLHATESKTHRSAILAAKAARIAAGAGEPEVKPSVRAATPEWAEVRVCEAWLKAPDAEGPGGSPSFDDLDALARTARDVGERESAARAPMDALAIAVVDATATGWTRQAWGDAVWDLASAERLMGSEVRGDDPWDVATQADGAKSSAVAEVDALERDFEAEDRSGSEWDWSGAADAGWSPP
jgi:hypothetical protein